MKSQLISTLILLVGVSPLISAMAPDKSAYTAATAKIAGDYVETRTAAVFCGGCHFNGEFVCAGKDAVLAWNFSSGIYEGVDLTGLRVMAAVGSDSNLGDETVSHKSELLIDSTATAAQAKAVIDLLKIRNATELGQIVRIHRGAISFSHVGTEYNVNAEGFGCMNVQNMPNDECCKQPSLVWYNPLTNLDHRKVGYTLHASYVGGPAGDPWQWEAENGSFYGAFSF